ncbi:hypothetical protein EJ03DRAFT_152099 [Teratosphaeria nubilosa]|uniref:Secreted protein n=1 Tax=Teratosphaeria nubilosa TaxID=161662 RepID=A0A6G1LLJ3_9PEZI|nr:hypothetical protein EJ03DRAFT_152099 [Teratosphaeria nubilosa]
MVSEPALGLLALFTLKAVRLQCGPFHHLTRWPKDTTHVHTAFLFESSCHGIDQHTLATCPGVSCQSPLTAGPRTQAASLWTLTPRVVRRVAINAAPRVLLNLMLWVFFCWHPVCRAHPFTSPRFLMTSCGSLRAVNRITVGLGLPIDHVRDTRRSRVYGTTRTSVRLRHATII